MSQIIERYTRTVKPRTITAVLVHGQWVTLVTPLLITRLDLVDPTTTAETDDGPELWLVSDTAPQTAVRLADVSVVQWDESEGAHAV